MNADRLALKPHEGRKDSPFIRVACPESTKGPRPVIEFGREVCGHLAAAAAREWLVTNGIGGYASGTLASLLTRRYHGLLIAALKPPLGRTLLLTKLDETAVYAGGRYPLHANRWAHPTPTLTQQPLEGIEPAGFHHLERFHLEGATPVWTYACADALLEKRVWMQPGANTTYIRYDLSRASAPMTLTVKALANYRDHHANTHAGDWHIEVETVERGLRVAAFDGATPFYLLSERARVAARHEWYRNYFLSVEDYRGLDALDDNLYVGDFEVSLQPGEAFTLVASTQADPDLDGSSAQAERRAYEEDLLLRAGVAPAPGSVAEADTRPAPTLLTPIARLILAADQFIVRRALPGEPDGLSVMAGYPWFGDWGRDTMISLPGLTLVTGRQEAAAHILRTYAGYVDLGMLPNRFPDEGEAPEYNTVDATLWYFEAMRAYHTATGDDALLRDLFPILEEIVAWHRRGTRYDIHVDAADGLLFAGQPGVQLTWMDAKVGDWVVTPRIGKPVEVNALWYNALQSMAAFARHLGQRPDDYDSLAEQARAGFARFWNAEVGCCYDVLDGPAGHDPAVRPNQLFAVSLPHSPLTHEQQRGVVDVCARRLLTSHGLRSLAPNHPAYTGRYGGDRRHRDGAYHQGTVWSWLIGPFVSAHLRVYGDRDLARSFLRPLVRHMSDHGLGSISEIFDGDPPFTPRGCIAQAWGVAELLRAWQATGDGESQ